MTDHPNKHCICHPPAELRAKWLTEDSRLHYCNTGDYAIDQAAEWGWQQRDTSVTEELQKARDEELQACCEWIANNSLHHAESDLLNDLRAARRPKPQSLAEKAQKALAHLLRHSSTELGSETIRRALERLQELEDQTDG